MCKDPGTKVPKKPSRFVDYTPIEEFLCVFKFNNTIESASLHKIWTQWSEQIPRLCTDTQICYLFLLSSKGKLTSCLHWGGETDLIQTSNTYTPKWQAGTESNHTTQRCVAYVSDTSFNLKWWTRLRTTTTYNSMPQHLLITVPISIKTRLHPNLNLFKSPLSFIPWSLENLKKWRTS